MAGCIFEETKYKVKKSRYIHAQINVDEKLQNSVQKLVFNAKSLSQNP